MSTRKRIIFEVEGSRYTKLKSIRQFFREALSLKGIDVPTKLTFEKIKELMRHLPYSKKSVTLLREPRSIRWGRSMYLQAVRGYKFGDKGKKKKELQPPSRPTRTPPVLTRRAIEQQRDFEARLENIQRAATPEPVFVPNSTIPRTASGFMQFTWAPGRVDINRPPMDMSQDAVNVTVTTTPETVPQRSLMDLARERMELNAIFGDDEIHT